MKYYEIRERADKLRALSIIIGGRGIGKTYSTIDYLVSTGEKFIYMRNTDVQLKESSTAFGNPFKRWALDHGRDIKIVKEGMHSVIVETVDNIPTEIGYAVALSTFENLRGVDLSDVKYVLFDEFIERRTLSFAQFETFANFYETVNRNREFNGEDPLKVIMLSNAQKLANPILAGYNFIPIIENMIKQGRKEYVSKHLYIALPESEVSEAKRQTANYVLANGSKFAAEALDNNFAYDSFYGVVKRNIVEYRPVCTIDDLYIYKHKSNSKYYICRSRALNIPEFTSKDSLTHFLRAFGSTIRDNINVGRVEYEDFVIKTQVLELLK